MTHNTEKKTYKEIKEYLLYQLNPLLGSKPPKSRDCEGCDRGGSMICPHLCTRSSFQPWGQYEITSDTSKMFQESLEYAVNNFTIDDLLYLTNNMKCFMADSGFPICAVPGLNDLLVKNCKNAYTSAFKHRIIPTIQKEQDSLKGKIEEDIKIWENYISKTKFQIGLVDRMLEC